MTYYADLSPYEYLGGQPPMLNVGWLGNASGFPIGVVAPDIVETLIRLAESQDNITRGVHFCEFCSTESPIRLPARNDRGFVSLGMGEIHVRDSQGNAFSAPSLIIHYILEHKYFPPQIFLAAIEELGRIP